MPESAWEILQQYCQKVPGCKATARILLEEFAPDLIKELARRHHAKTFTRKPIRPHTTWHDIVIECERILGCTDTAESPLQSNLPNLVRDLLPEKTSRARDPYSPRALIRRAIRNAKPMYAGRSMPRWSIISHMFGLGSTQSIRLCRESGTDPDEIIQGQLCEDCLLTDPGCQLCLGIVPKGGMELPADDEECDQQ